MYNHQLISSFLSAARRMAAARKMKQLRGENPDNDNEQNDEDLLAEMTPGDWSAYVCLCLLAEKKKHKGMVVKQIFENFRGMTLFQSKLDMCAM